jgi:hypothetical protein
MGPRLSSTIARAKKIAVLVLFAETVACTAGAISSAQTQTAPPIRVETREVVLPVRVFEERKDPKGLLTSPNGDSYHVWIVRSKDITGLSPKSVHIFEDGVEQKIEHFSVESLPNWLVKDNVAEHLEFSWTPKGIWGGAEKKQIPVDYSLGPLQTYLLTYVPPPSIEGSCHRIVVKVAHRHATVLAPDQYCNKKDPLSDPLNGTELGNRLLEYVNSAQSGTVPLSLQLSEFPGPSGAYRVNVSVQMPADLLERKWEGNQLHTSIAVLGLVYKNHALNARFSDSLCLPSECRIWFNGPLSPGKTPLPPILETEEYFASLIVPTTYQTQIDLEPGDYQFELVLTDGAEFGRASASLTIDDFAKGRLAIGGMALCKRYRQASGGPRPPNQAPQYVPLVAKGAEFTPAADTHFRPSDQMTIYFEVYEPLLAGTEPINVQFEMKITDIMTGDLKVSTGPRPEDPGMQPGNLVIPNVWDLAVDKLPAGTYRLEVQASDSAGNKTAWRATSFTVDHQ